MNAMRRSILCSDTQCVEKFSIYSAGKNAFTAATPTIGEHCKSTIFMAVVSMISGHLAETIIFGPLETG